MTDYAYLTRVIFNCETRLHDCYNTSQDLVYDERLRETLCCDYRPNLRPAIVAQRPFIWFRLTTFHAVTALYLRVQTHTL